MLRVTAGGSEEICSFDCKVWYIFIGTIGKTKQFINIRMENKKVFEKTLPWLGQEKVGQFLFVLDSEKFQAWCYTARTVYEASFVCR